MLVDDLRAARARYAANPSHAPAGTLLEPGTYCLVSVFMEHIPDNHYALVGAAGTRRLVDYNAEHSTEHVLTLFDRAIETAEGGRPVPAWRLVLVKGDDRCRLEPGYVLGRPFKAVCPLGTGAAYALDWLHSAIGGTWRAELVA